MSNLTEQRVEEIMRYVYDFHAANDEWPTRNDWADFLGRYDRQSLPGIRSAINRGVLRYGDGDRLVPTAEYNQDTKP